MINRAFTLCLAVLLWTGLVAPHQAFANEAQCEALFASQEKAQLAEETPEQFAQRIASVNSLVYKISEGRQLFLQMISARDPEKPVFLLLPGINRGWLKTDPAFQNLAKFGNGVVTMNFSTQPLSVNTLPDGVKPAFENKVFSLQDLAFEVESLISFLQENGVKNVIPVTLSYSGILAPYLNKRPLSIDTVPMTSMAATNPEVDKSRQTLNFMASFNPFFGSSIASSMMRMGYYKNWSNQIDSTIKTFGLNPARREDMIEGYVSMSVAAEGSSWDFEKLSSNRRVFIFASGESPSLLADQMATARKFLETHGDTLIIVINESGHVIPTDQPMMFASVIDAVGTTALSSARGVVVMTPSTGKSILIPAEQANTFFNNMAPYLKQKEEKPQ